MSGYEVRRGPGAARKGRNVLCKTIQRLESILAPQRKHDRSVDATESGIR